MASDDAVLSVALQAKVRDFERQMKEAGDKADAAVRDIENRFSQANPQLNLGPLTNALKGFLGAFSLERLFSAFREANQELIKLGETAKSTGVELNTLAALRRISSIEGIDQTKLTKGLEGLASALNEARREENDLSKLLDANNIKYKDRNGQVISTNEALRIAADLINRAATEQDKIKIAETLGLTREWVRVLEGGPAAFDAAIRKANELGATLDYATIAKAKEFETTWNTAWTNFATWAKAALQRAADGLDEYQRRSAREGLFGWMGQDDRRLPPRDTQLRPGETGGQPSGTLRDPSTDNLVAQLNEQQRRRAGLGRGPGPTVIPPSSSNSGSSETTEAEKAQARLDKYIETLMRQEAVEKALADTVGQSRAAQQAAVEIAKAQVDLNKLDAETRTTMIAKITEQVQKLELQRQATQRVQRAHRDMIQLQEFAGNTLIDAFDRMIVGGESFGQVIGNVTRQLAKMVLQAALLGQGPLASLFGVAGPSGGVGGFIGALFGGFRADGGPMAAGRAYMVGERGPEVVVPGQASMVIPNHALVQAGNAGTSVTLGDTFIDARGSQMTEGQFRALLEDNNRRMAERIPGLVRQAQTDRRL